MSLDCVYLASRRPDFSLRLTKNFHTHCLVYQQPLSRLGKALRRQRVISPLLYMKKLRLRGDTGDLFKVMSDSLRPQGQ